MTHDELDAQYEAAERFDRSKARHELLRDIGTAWPQLWPDLQEQMADALLTDWLDGDALTVALRAYAKGWHYTGQAIRKDALLEQPFGHERARLMAVKDIVGGYGVRELRDGVWFVDMRSPRAPTVIFLGQGFADDCEDCPSVDGCGTNRFIVTTPFEYLTGVSDA